ncbi:MAG: DUF4136 domain-containing protein [Maribacter sp.]
MKTSFFVLLLVVCSSCGGTKVIYDYDSGTDFKAYSTYNYFEDMETGLSDLDENRFMDAMDATLGEKGLMFAEEADILINIRTSVFESRPNNNVGVGLGGGGRTLGGGVSIGIPVGGPKVTSELKIDFVDANKDILIWQAVGTSPFREGDTPIEKVDKVQVFLAKVFSKYPPK